MVADGVDVGLLAVDKADKDRNSDCWLSSWWLSEDFRGKEIPQLIVAELPEGVNASPKYTGLLTKPRLLIDGVMLS